MIGLRGGKQVRRYRAIRRLKSPHCRNPDTGNVSTFLRRRSAVNQGEERVGIPERIYDPCRTRQTLRPETFYGADSPSFTGLYDDGLATRFPRILARPIYSTL